MIYFSENMKLQEVNQIIKLKSDWGNILDFNQLECYFNIFVELYRYGFGKHFVFHKYLIFIDIGTQSFYSPIAFSLAFKAVSKNDIFSSDDELQRENPFLFIAMDKNEINIKNAISLSKFTEDQPNSEDRIWNYTDCGSDYGYIYYNRIIYEK
jgi:hypothetical protein